MRFFSTASEAYLSIVRETLHNPWYTVYPRGLKCYEIADLQYRILNPQVGPIVTLDEERNKVIADYTEKELQWYISGNLEAKSAPSRFWEKLADPNGNIASNYGYLVLKDKSEGLSIENHWNQQFESREQMRTPYEWALESLKKDKDSRQALMRVNKPEHAWVGQKDFPCTISVVATIRDDKLNFSVVQRSGDANFGVVYDIPWWIWLQHQMTKDLSSTYPDLKVGYFTHLIHSFHIYDKDVERIKKMLGE